MAFSLSNGKESSSMSSARLIEGLNLEGLVQKQPNQAPVEVDHSLWPSFLIWRAKVLKRLDKRKTHESEEASSSNAERAESLMASGSSDSSCALYRGDQRSKVGRAWTVGHHGSGQPLTPGISADTELSVDPFLEPVLTRKAPRVSITGQDHSEELPEVGTQDSGADYRQCVACREEKHRVAVVEVTCRHCYCNDCLDQLIQTALAACFRLPPQCCQQPIPMSAIGTLVPETIVKKYQDRLAEQEREHNFFCCDESCAVLIPPSNISDHTGRCPRCSELTCTMCRGSGEAHDCSEDAALNEVLAAAIDSKWQRCPACGRIVEKTGGCNHISLVTL